MEKIVGIVYAYDTAEEYDMVREIGVSWIGLNVSFPWVDRPDPTSLPVGWPDVCAVKSWFHAVGAVHTPEEQAEYLRHGHDIFATHPHAVGSFMFCWSDAHQCYHCGQSDCPAECFWGVADKDCNPKPAYEQVKRAIREYY